MKVLITGVAGFIGSALASQLLARGDHVVGIDNLNDYYEVSLKRNRLKNIAHDDFTFIELDIASREDISKLFQQHQFDAVMNLAAQAGVRYSIENPAAYIDANLVGFGNILEACRQTQVGNLVYASSSSVYGANTIMPFSEKHNVDHPVSLYAATKKANEVMAHSYAHLYKLPCTGLRFFTVYGPWGRPDMALFKFAKNIVANKPIDVYNKGDMVRDFTYIDDIVDGIIRTLDNPASANLNWDSERPDPSSSKAPFRIYNIGNSQPVKLMRYIEVLEEALGIKAQINFMPMQAGDVPATYADVSQLSNQLGYRPKISVEVGVANFVKWYRQYYGC